MVIVRLRLELRRDTSTAAASATSTQHTLIYRELVVVLSIIVVLRILYDEIVLLLLNLQSLTVLIICHFTHSFSAFHAYLSYFLI